MNDELQELLKQKRELERKIKILTTGSVINDIVKIDRISYAGKYNKGKWAVYYRYEHNVNAGRYPGHLEKRWKWQPIVNGDSIDEVIDRIPELIKALTDLYEQAKGERHGTDT